MRNHKFWNRLMFTGVLAGGLLFASAGTARADRDWKEDCHRRLESDRARIDRDAARRGEHSPQVNHDVERMNSDRQWCRDHKADWDHDRFDIGIYFRK